MQEKIPNWKKTSLVLKEESKQEKESIVSQYSNKFKNHFNETKFA